MSDRKEMHLVFVYGSLKAGFGNHRVIQPSLFLGEGRLAQCGAMYSLGGFPAVTLGERNSPIHGELYEVDDVIFGRLDRLEGHPNFYKREQVDVLQEDEDEVFRVKAWVYLMDAKSPALLGAPPVVDGIWRENVRRVV